MLVAILEVMSIVSEVLYKHFGIYLKAIFPLTWQVLKNKKHAKNENGTLLQMTSCVFIGLSLDIFSKTSDPWCHWYCQKSKTSSPCRPLSIPHSHTIVPVVLRPVSLFFSWCQKEQLLWCTYFGDYFTLKCWKTVLSHQNQDR